MDHWSPVLNEIGESLKSRLGALTGEHSTGLTINNVQDRIKTVEDESSEIIAEFQKNAAIFSAGITEHTFDSLMNNKRVSELPHILTTVKDILKTSNFTIYYHTMKTQYFPIAVFFFLFMITSPRAGAQEGEVYVSLAGGVSIPLSDYANTDFNDESSGFAMIGGNFAINFGYKLNEYLSLSGLLSGSVNRYNYIKLQDWFTENYKESLPDTRWLVESKNWGLGGLMIGVTGSIPLKPNKLNQPRLLL